MHINWTKGHKDKEYRKEQVRGYRHVLNDLKSILEKEYKKKDAVREYSSPGWAHEQIAVNEYNQALDDLIKLLDIDK